MQVQTIALAVTATLSIAILTGCSFGGSVMLKTCERALAERLLAPSTYQRIETTERHVKLTADQWTKLAVHEGDAVIALQRQSIAAGTMHPILFDLIIRYEAQNAAGVPIRNSARCDYVANDGDSSRATWWGVKINGLDHTDWLAAQAPAAAVSK